MEILIQEEEHLQLSDKFKTHKSRKFLMRMHLCNLFVFLLKLSIFIQVDLQGPRHRG